MMTSNGHLDWRIWEWRRHIPNPLGPWTAPVDSQKFKSHKESSHEILKSLC
jgi:hypothetical protein